MIHIYYCPEENQSKYFNLDICKNTFYKVQERRYRYILRSFRTKELQEMLQELFGKHISFLDCRNYQPYIKSIAFRIPQSVWKKIDQEQFKSILKQYKYRSLYEEITKINGHPHKLICIGPELSKKQKIYMKILDFLNIYKRVVLKIS